MEREKIFNVPNMLSMYRIIAVPFILYLIYIGRQDLFLIFLCVNLLTDVLDGAIARTFSLQTKFGARLDSLGDIGTYIVVAMGVIRFKWHDMAHAGGTLWIFVFFFLLPYFISYVRFSKFPSLHLYSSKIGGAIDVVFFFCLFTIGFKDWLLIAAISWGILSFIEQSIILVLLKELKSDQKGLYWVLKGIVLHLAD